MPRYNEHRDAALKALSAVVANLSDRLDVVAAQVSSHLERVSGGSVPPAGDQPTSKG